MVLILAASSLKLLAEITLLPVLSTFVYVFQVLPLIKDHFCCLFLPVTVSTLVINLTLDTNPATGHKDLCKFDPALLIRLIKISFVHLVLTLSSPPRWCRVFSASSAIMMVVNYLCLINELVTFFLTSFYACVRVRATANQLWSTNPT